MNNFATSTLRERLKNETRAEHVELENRMAILSPSLSRDRYFEILSCFANLHQQFEAKLSTVDSELAQDYLANRRKSAFLAEDLAGNNVTREDLNLELGWLSNEDELLGALYVIEGSTLGGQVVTKSLRALHPEIPVRYFSGYQAETGKMWQKFTSHLAEIPTSREDAVIHGAAMMFQTFLSVLP